MCADEHNTNDQFRSARDRAEPSSNTDSTTTSDRIFRSARESSNLDLNTSQAVKFETVTVYKSKMFPGFRPCTPEDYRDKVDNPIACQDDEVARMLSTREDDLTPRNTIVGDDNISRGNIYQLRFERFKRKKN